MAAIDETIDDVVMAPTDGVELEGHLAIPEGAEGIVVFAHGSGSSRHSPRNQHVAEVLREGGLGTFLVDLLTEEEDKVDRQTREHRFDIDMLAERVAGLARWVGSESRTEMLNIGLFGSSTGAAAAIRAAADIPGDVEGVVSRGGRPDLADEALERIETPCLFIVGGKDAQVLQMNQDAMDRMHAPVDLEIVPGASHLFEEPGKLAEVADVARDWFVDHLASEPGDRARRPRPRA